MRRTCILVSFALLTWSQGRADDCAGLSEALELPKTVKSRGKPKRMHWEQINRLLPELRKAAGQQPCRLTFGQVFQPKQPEAFFPLLDSVLRTVPEQELAGVAVFYLDGDQAGHFANRVILEKGRYLQYYFQFTDKEGKLQASGRSLLDFSTGKPSFLVRWKDIEGKLIISSQGDR